MKLRLLAIVAAVAIVGSACTLRETKEYIAYPGVGSDGPWAQMELKKATNDLIVITLWADVCHGASVASQDGAARCATGWLKANTNLEGWGAAQWYTALDRVKDFGDAVMQVRVSPIWNKNCLALRLNWTNSLDWLGWGNSCG